MKKTLIIMLSLAVLMSFTACEDKPAGSVPTKGEELKELFGTYSSELSVNDDGTGIVLGLESDTDESGEYRVGASTWLGESDKLTDFVEGESITVDFTLDLSSMAENDYTTFSLSYGDHHSETDGSWFFDYKTETIFTVLKTAEGYTVAQVNNVDYYGDETNRTLVSSSSKSKDVTDDDGVIDFTYTAQYNSEGKSLSVSLMVNDTEAFDFTINGGEDAIAAIKGVGYLWNCMSNIDTVEMLDLSWT